MRILRLERAWTFVWLRNFTVYARGWKTNIIPPLIQPIGFLLIMGIGLGHYVKEVEGMSYLVFVTPAIMATESLMRAAFECTYGSFYRMTYQHTFDAIISTPVTPYEVAFGEIMWGATKSLFSSTVLFIVMLILGVIHNPIACLSFIVILIGGVNFAAISIAFSAKAKEFEHFQFYFAIMFPLIFVCGSYFPLSRLPEPLQYILWILPLTHIIDVTRSLISGIYTPFFFWKIAYVTISTILLVEIAIRLLAKRLID